MRRVYKVKKGRMYFKEEVDFRFPFQEIVWKLKMRTLGCKICETLNKKEKNWDYVGHKIKGVKLDWIFGFTPFIVFNFVDVSHFHKWEINVLLLNSIAKFGIISWRML